MNADPKNKDAVSTDPDIRFLTDFGEKQAARALYEEAFPEDGKAFVDYYFAEKCRDNVITALLSPDGRILSAAHLNPYPMMVSGTVVPTYYLVAVATTAPARHQGLMTRVLAASIRYMAARGVPFAWLLPVDEAIYTPFGFRTICDFTLRKIPYAEVRANFDVYCIQDETYRRREKIEASLSEGDTNTGLPAHPVIMAYPADRARLRGLLDLPDDADDDAMLGALRSRRIYLCEEV